MSLGARLRFARGAKELSLAALSERCGVTKAYLMRAEHDDTNLSLAIVERIAAGLDVRPAWLAWGPEPPEDRLQRLIVALDAEPSLQIDYAKAAASPPQTTEKP